MLTDDNNRRNPQPFNLGDIATEAAVIAGIKIMVNERYSDISDPTLDNLPAIPKYADVLALLSEEC